MRASRKSLSKGFDACAAGESHFPSGLAFPRSPKVIFRKVWHFRARRKSFPEGYGISALGETHFPSGLAFPRLAKVISRRVWRFRTRRKSFPEGFGISAHGESRFPKGLAFPRLAKVVSRKVWHFRAWRNILHKKRQNIEINITRIYHIFKVNPESYLSNFRGFCLFLGGCNLFNKSKKTLCVRNVQRGEYVL